jgi:outer membrane protein TolC
VSVSGTRGNSMEREFGTLLERHTDRAEAGLRWNLYNGGNDVAELKAGTRELAAAAQDLRRAREDTSERLAETYVDVLRLQTLLPYAEARLKAVRHLVDQVKRQNAAGKASDADATQAEASLLDAQMQVDLLTSDLDSARAKLAAEVGTEVRDALPVLLKPVPMGAAAYGVPGLVDSARLKAEAARERVRPRLSLLAPRIDLEFRRQLGDQTRPAPTTEQQRVWLLTARWDFPVMGESLARRTETQRRAEAAEAEADRVARVVQADLKALDARITNAQRTLALLDQQILQYDQLLRAGELQYEAGRRTLSQLIQLRESRFNIEQRRVEQDHKLLAARMRQLALTGQLLPALGLPSLPSEVSDPS